MPGSAATARRGSSKPASAYRLGRCATCRIERRRGGCSLRRSARASEPERGKLIGQGPGLTLCAEAGAPAETTLTIVVRH